MPTAAIPAEDEEEAHEDLQDVTDKTKNKGPMYTTGD